MRLVAIGAAVAALFTAGCSAERSGGGPAAGPAGPVKVGLVTKTDTNPYFVTLRDAAKAAADQQGAQLIALAGKFDGDNEGQVAAIENLVQQGVKGILITPSNSGGIIAALQQAKSRGITVIALDTETDPKDAVDATWATDNTDAGRKQGAYVKAALNGTAPKLLMVDGTSGAAVDTQRHNGFLAGFGIAEGDPSILCEANTGGDQAKGQTAMENCLQKAPDINLVYTINEPAAMGAYQALKAAGKDKSVTIVTVDGSCTGVNALSQGQFAADSQQYPLKMASLGVDAIMNFAKTGKKPSGYTDTGVTLIAATPAAGVDSKDAAYGQSACWGS